MDGQTNRKFSWHPSDGDLMSQLDGQSGWIASLRLRMHLRHCRGCAARLATMEEYFAPSSAGASELELNEIRRNLMQAIRSYERQEHSPVFPISAELRRTLEEYLGVRMAAQLAERTRNGADRSEAYDSVDRTLRLLLGGKAAASLKARLLQESSQ